MVDRNLEFAQERALDGNALAGLFQEIFIPEMTACPAECAHCGHQGEIGGSLAFLAGPGVVVRCPVCQGVLLKIVTTPDAYYLDARGMAYFRMERQAV